MHSITAAPARPACCADAPDGAQFPLQEADVSNKGPAALQRARIWVCWGPLLLIICLRSCAHVKCSVWLHSLLCASFTLSRLCFGAASTFVFASFVPLHCSSKSRWKYAVMLTWALRCIPVLSSVLLFVVAYSAFQEPSDSSPSFYTKPGCYSLDCWKPLSLSQYVYIAYALLMHLQLLIYGPQLCISLHWLTRNIKAVRDCRIARTLTSKMTKSSDVDFHTDSGYTSDDSLTSGSDVAITLPDQPTSEDCVVHTIILPNYMEELDTLRETLSVLASHARASQQYEVCSCKQRRSLVWPRNQDIRHHQPYDY